MSEVNGRKIPSYELLNAPSGTLVHDIVKDLRGNLSLYEVVSAMINGRMMGSAVNSLVSGTIYPFGPLIPSLPLKKMNEILGKQHKIYSAKEYAEAAIDIMATLVSNGFTVRYSFWKATDDPKYTGEPDYVWSMAIIPTCVSEDEYANLDNYKNLPLATTDHHDPYALELAGKVFGF